MKKNKHNITLKHSYIFKKQLKFTKKDTHPQASHSGLRSVVSLLN